MKDFYARLGRLNKAHTTGSAFETTGVLGRAHFRRPRHKNRLKILMPVVLLLMASFGLKGAIHFFVGAKTYESRIASLQQGAGFDRLGAALMAPDRVTLWLSETLRRSLQTQN